MNTKLINTVSASLLCITLTACETDFDSPISPGSADAGDADFTTFVAIGDSLTAGVADGTLYSSGQENSYPNMLAGQFGLAGGGMFAQPLVADNLGGMILPNPAPALSTRLVFDAATTAPEPIAGTPTTDVAVVTPGPYNNMGVPSAKSFHLLSNTYGDPTGVLPQTANPYYVRMASSASGTMISDAAAQVPTFFVLWIGNNDILSYATGGGTGVVRDSGGSMADPDYDAMTYGSEDITDTTLFSDVYNGLLLTLAGVNPSAKGVLVNIPNVNAIPYFTAVPFNPVPLDQATADLLMGNPGDMGYTDYNLGLDMAVDGSAITQDEANSRYINFAAGLNGVVIEIDPAEDPEFTDLTPGLPNIRQTSATDLIVLPARSKIGTESVMGDPTSTWGLGEPLEDADVLTGAEQVFVETARTAFNATISAAATGNPNLVLYDAAAALDTLSVDGIDYGPGSITDDYVTGGGFSLDGIHPTARGYAVIANGIIDTINTSFNASIPPVDPGAKTTIFFK